ncbi:uncharacterized protein RJT21DRAFT_120030 [Scheffersomyces amazonensis]|uniref:uncharacterized protein n=1 Tax=Scheffersomyces amazonensis TaxID=1078765 RepID=UPI00315D69AD
MIRHGSKLLKVHSYYHYERRILNTKQLVTRLTGSNVVIHRTFSTNNAWLCNRQKSSHEKKYDNSQYINSPLSDISKEGLNQSPNGGVYVPEEVQPETSGASGSEAPEASESSEVSEAAHADITANNIENPISTTNNETTSKEEDNSSLSFGSSDFLTTIFDDMEPFMDTYQVYEELLQAGFTPSQADEIINLVIVQLNSKLSKLSSKYSQVYELENERYLFESAQQELRVDVTRSREQHINELITLTNVLERDFSIISDELNNDFLQMKNDNQVAINDQKSENTLSSKKIILRIQETNHKITTELNSAMRSEIESLRWNLSRWGLIAILITIFSGCAAFYGQKARHAKHESMNSEFVPLVIYEPSEYDEDDYHTDLDKTVIE